MDSPTTGSSPLRRDSERASAEVGEAAAEELRESLAGETASPTGALAASGSLGYLPLRLAQYAFLFVSTLIVTRALGPVGRAQYALPLALAGGIWVLTHLTLEIAASRMLARAEAPLLTIVRVLSLCLLVLSLLASAVSLALGLALRTFVLADATALMVVLASLTIPFLLSYQLAGQILIVRGRLRAHGTATALGGLLQLGSVLILVSTGRLTPTTALAAALLGFAITAILIVWMLGRYVGWRAFVPSREQSVLRPLLRTGAMLHPGTVALQLDPRVSLLLVGAFLTPRDAGLYSLALTLTGSVLLAAQALSISAVHRQYLGDEPQAVAFTLDFIRQCFLVTTAAAFLMASVAYPFIVLVYGHAFAGATVPFVLLLAVTVAMAIEAPCRVLLVRIAPPLLVSAVVCSTIVANVVLTVAMIQVLSITGAALAAFCSYTCLAGFMLRLVARLTGAPVGSVFRWPHRDDEAVRLLMTAAARLHRTGPT